MQVPTKLDWQGATVILSVETLKEEYYICKVLFVNCLDHKKASTSAIQSCNRTTHAWWQLWSLEGKAHTTCSLPGWVARCTSKLTAGCRNLSLHIICLYIQSRHQWRSLQHQRIELLLVWCVALKMHKHAHPLFFVSSQLQGIDSLSTNIFCHLCCSQDLATKELCRDHGGTLSATIGQMDRLLPWA